MYLYTIIIYYYLHFVFNVDYYCNLFMLKHGGMFTKEAFVLLSFSVSTFNVFFIFKYIVIHVELHLCECWNTIIELN